MQRLRLIPALCLALLVAACKVGPDYVEPEVEVTDQWHAAVEDEMSRDEPDIVKWWENLGDTTLTNLIRESEPANLNLRIAVARVAEVRALRGIAKGDLYPDLVLEGTYSRFQLSENSPTGQAIIAAGGEVEPSSQWESTASSFWEIDLFGRIRRGVEAATAEYEASIEDYRDVLVSLYAEVALSYVEARSLQRRLAFAEQNVAAQRESLELTRDRFDAGLTSALDVAQAEQNLAQTESTIPTLETGLNASLNRLAVLLGEQPGSLHDRLATAGEAALPREPVDIMVGVPADILRRRPDVRGAERRLAAQTARIGVATADLYPTFSLGGFVQAVAGTFSGQFDGESIGWGVLPGFRWDLFRGGKIRNNIRAEEARTDQALFAYQQTILLAFEEVENAMIRYDRERIRRARLQEAADASQRAVELVRTQYLSGLTNFQNLLDTQRSLFNQQDELAASEGQVIQNLIQLNRALGGGWTVQPEAPDRLSNSEATGAEPSSNDSPSPAQENEDARFDR
ncbi:MAG TPA: efflux transporter outer membrane subunit [Gemmatimonadota bacterium]|nr:efflux transporter outer membrane subunit [Gemmatimonadota bacterium]